MWRCGWPLSEEIKNPAHRGEQGFSESDGWFSLSACLLAERAALADADDRNRPHCRKGKVVVTVGFGS
jgi:hypothetical protein